MEIFTFHYSITNDENETVGNTHTFDGNWVTHEAVAEKFNQFLAGCGFVLPQGEEYVLGPSA